MKRRSNKLILLLAIVSVACIVAALVLMNLDRRPPAGQEVPIAVITPPPSQDATAGATGFYPVTALMDAGQQAALGQQILAGISAGAAQGESAYGAVPGEQDIPWTQAFATATDTLKSRYGLTDADLRGFSAAFEFVNADGAGMWHVQFAPADAQAEGLDSYVVSVRSPGGEVESASDSSDAVG